MRDVFLKLSSIAVASFTVEFIVNIWSVSSSHCGCLVQKRIERSFCQILEDQLLGDGPGLLEHQELLEDDRLLQLGAHVPSIQRVATRVLQ